MHRLLFLCAFASLGAFAQITYSTGAVRDYIPNGCGGPELPATLPEANLFRACDGAGNDLEPGGGSGLPQVYLFAGHGSCQNPPNANSPDFILTCSPNGTPNTTNIGNSTRWGNDNLRFAFVDASCPMDSSRSSISGSRCSGACTSRRVTPARARRMRSTARCAAISSARTADLPSPLDWFVPQQSVGNAWMGVGINDVQSGCCAVVVAAGATEADVVNRRENERVYSGWGNPVANWIAWRWLCRG